MEETSRAEQKALIRRIEERIEVLKSQIWYDLENWDRINERIGNLEGEAMELKLKL